MMPNNSKLQTGTRFGMRRMLDLSPSPGQRPSAEFQVPIADVGRYAQLTT